MLVPRHDGTFDAEECARRYQLYAGGDVEPVLDEIERLITLANAGFERMHAARGLDERRRIGRESGPAIGQIDALLRLAIAMAPPHARPVLTTSANLASGQAVGEYLAATGRVLADDY